MTAPAATVPASPARTAMNWGRVRTVARTDLRQLLGARDFWVPMAGLGALFFVVIPTLLLLMITRVDNVQVVEQLSTTLEVLPQRARRVAAP